MVTEAEHREETYLSLTLVIYLWNLDLNPSIINWGTLQGTLPISASVSNRKNGTDSRNHSRWMLGGFSAPLVYSTNGHYYCHQQSGWDFHRAWTYHASLSSHLSKDSIERLGRRLRAVWTFLPIGSQFKLRILGSEKSILPPTHPYLPPWTPWSLSDASTCALDKKGALCLFHPSSSLWWAFVIARPDTLENEHY